MPLIIYSIFVPSTSLQTRQIWVLITFKCLTQLFQRFIVVSYERVTLLNKTSCSIRGLQIEQKPSYYILMTQNSITVSFSTLSSPESLHISVNKLRNVFILHSWNAFTIALKTFPSLPTNYFPLTDFSSSPTFSLSLYLTRNGPLH